MLPHTARDQRWRTHAGRTLLAWASSIAEIEYDDDDDVDQDGDDDADD